MKLSLTIAPRRRTLICLLLSTLCVQTLAQGLDGAVYHQLKDFPFVIVSDDYVATPPTVSDSLFDAAAVGLRFKVNRTELQPTDPFIPLFRERLLPWLKTQDMELRQVYVKGAASPEGPYQNNVRLSRGRTARLIEFISREMGDKPDLANMVSASSVTEDYGLLVKMMGQAGDADYDRVRRLWLDCQGDEACCKRRLMALDGGRLWRRLLRQYFPQLRQARVVLWFARRQPPVAVVVAEQKQATGAFARVERRPEGVSLTVHEELNPTINISVAPPLPVYRRRHLIALRTNLLHDLFYMPNFGFAPGINAQIEYYPLRGHYTLNAAFTYTNHRRWSSHKFFQWRDAQLELRRYFRGGGVFTGPYLGLYAQGTVYGIGFSATKGWQGEGGGGGLSLGYVWPLNRKGNLRLELSASAGAFVTRYDPYIYNHPYVGRDDGLYYYDYYGNAANFQERNYRFTWFGPTNAGLHLTYDIIYRKKQRVK
ncbi:MAG: DUF3575 domain-containing protein [Prevotella sp.]|nr:DUF3575 domain-containing protein [Prevotella sp.]